MARAGEALAMRMRWIAAVAASTLAGCVTAAPLPVPPPIVRVHTPQPENLFMVFFEFDRADPEVHGMAVLRLVVQAVQARPYSLVRLAGHTDTAEPRPRETSRLRVEAVRRVLIELGVDPNRIETSFHGAAAPHVRTEDDVREPLNRRVEIEIVRPGG